MITAGQVRDLNVGDVVEITDTRYPRVKVLGELHEHDGALVAGSFAIIRFPDGDTSSSPTRELRVVKRAEPPRPPLYTNSPRTAPVQGDVVRLPDDPRTNNLTWFYTDGGWWATSSRNRIIGGLPRPAVLLVDGTTGRTVQ